MALIGHGLVALKGNEKMKTIKELKKALQVGSQWHCYNHLFEKDLGIRKISIVQSNKIAFKTEKNDSWLDYPKKSEVIFHADGNGFDIVDSDLNIILTYKKA